MYFAYLFLVSIILTPKAIGFPDKEFIGKIILFLNLSKYIFLFSDIQETLWKLSCDTNFCGTSSNFKMSGFFFHCITNSFVTRTYSTAITYCLNKCLSDI